MANRSSRAQIARETLEILERGQYVSPSGNQIHVEVPLRICQGRFKTVTFRSDRLVGRTAIHSAV